jgi:hypothetical protein
MGFPPNQIEVVIQAPVRNHAMTQKGPMHLLGEEPVVSQGTFSKRKIPPVPRADRSGAPSNFQLWISFLNCKPLLRLANGAKRVNKIVENGCASPKPDPSKIEYFKKIA